MENTTDKKLPVRNLERIGEKKFKTYEEAKAAQANSNPGSKFDKSKVFARNDGTFDTVWYRKISVTKEQVAESMDKAKAADVVIAVKKVHGLKSKDRKKPFVPKKFA